MSEPVYYRYRDAHGALLYSVVRHPPKVFELLGPSGKTIKQFPAKTVLYRLPELLAAADGACVYVCEGEKDADRLAELGFAATTNPGGCRLGWKPEYTACFAGRIAVILVDNDRPGIRHAEKVLTALRDAEVASVDLLLPRLRRAEDVSDWLDFRSGSIDELLQLTGQRFAQSWPAAPPHPEGGHKTRHAVFSSKLSSTEKLVLLAIQHYSGSGGRVTVGTLADAAGLHRVTTQKVLSLLRERKIVRRAAVGRAGLGWQIEANRLA